MPYEELPCVSAWAVYKRRGRWYAALACPGCHASLRVRLSLGPMVARCQTCAQDIETDVGPVLAAGTA